jgi:hypothetical protein
MDYDATRVGRSASCNCDLHSAVTRYGRHQPPQLAGRQMAEHRSFGTGEQGSGLACEGRLAGMADGVHGRPLAMELSPRHEPGDRAVADSGSAQLPAGDAAPLEPRYLRKPLFLGP